MKRVILVLLVTFLMAIPVYADNFLDGVDAYNNKDYKEAIRLFRLAIDQGLAQAQNNLGSMYDSGQGVPQDYKEAIKWYRLSAEQGYAEAQYNLGVMYGYKIPQDFALAHMWFNLCVPSGDKDCVKHRNIVEKKMSKQQIEEAQEMALKWKSKK